MLVGISHIRCSVIAFFVHAKEADFLVQKRGMDGNKEQLSQVTISVLFF